MTSGAGERAALRGYRQQYDQAAAEVYYSMVDDTFDWMVLAADDVGQVDDLLVARAGRVEGFQYKHSEYPQSLTLHQLVTSRTTASGTERPSLLRSLAEGWKRLRSEYGRSLVHLATNNYPSTNERVVDGPPARRFAEFVETVLGPISQGTLDLADVPPDWNEALNRLERASDLDPDDFTAFLGSLRLDFGLKPPIETPDRTAAADIVDLSDALYRAVTNSHEPLRLEQADVLALVGWDDRVRTRATHRFPVNLDTYTPLTSAINALTEKLDRVGSGYIALTGPPGCGKSTLLDQALSGRPERLIRYYAYVPGSGVVGHTRLTAEAFLHDLAVSLSRAGLSHGARLVPRDLAGLRASIGQQIEQASTEYQNEGRGTVIIVDGLDHVLRDAPTGANLLSELLAPDEVPDGVVFIVGTRTLRPLTAAARQHIIDENRRVDLSDERLDPEAVRNICTSYAATAALGAEVHNRIVELADGYPLALAYLLNRVDDASSRQEALERLENAEPFRGDIRLLYAGVWDSIDDSPDVQHVLSVCARLRVEYTRAGLAEYFSEAAVQAVWQTAGYLFRSRGEHWQVFHDSFRQYVAEQTAADFDGRPSTDLELTEQQKVAEFCAASTDPELRWEELYHRERAQQFEAVVALGSQEAFREQYAALRSPQAILDDIATVARAAGHARDLPSLVGAVLAGAEASNRAWHLERVDLCRVLHAADRTQEAIRLAAGPRRSVPLAHAYLLAARLGFADNPEGRRVFDTAEVDGFEDPDRTTVSGEEHGAAHAWGRAAPFYRPIDRVLDVIDQLAPRGPSAGRLRISDHLYRQLGADELPGVPSSALDDILAQVETRNARDDGTDRARLRAVVNGAADTLNRTGQTEQLGRLATEIDAYITRIETATEAAQPELFNALERAEAALEVADPAADNARGVLSELREQVETSGGFGAEMAELIDIRVHLGNLLIENATTADSIRAAAAATLEAASQRPAWHSTWLTLAELAVRFRLDPGPDILGMLPFHRAVTASRYEGRTGDVWVTAVRYWRLRRLLDLRESPDARTSPPLPTSTPPSPDTPAGDDVTQSAAIHQDVEAIEMAERLDGLAIEMACALADIESGRPAERSETRGLVLRAIGIAQELGRADLDLHRFRATGLEVLRYALRLAVAGGFGDALSVRIRDRFREDPTFLPVDWLVATTATLRDNEVGVDTDLQSDVLARAESAARELGGLDRLIELADLVPSYADGDDAARVRQLCDEIVLASFSIGYRKDYQFDEWVGWFGRFAETHRERAVEESAPLAELIVAVTPMTEGAPARAAAELPGLLALADPGRAVMLLGYLVRHGAASHSRALAILIAALCDQLRPDDVGGAATAAELVARVLVRSSASAHVQTATSLLKAAERAEGSARRTAVTDMVESAVKRWALPSTRDEWLAALDRRSGQGNADPVGGTSASSSPEYGALHLADTEPIPSDEALARIQSVADALEYRGRETDDSTFDWTKALESLDLGTTELHELADAIIDERTRSLTIRWFARRFAQQGETDRAKSLAHRMVEESDHMGWIPYWGGGTLDGYRILVDLGDESATDEALTDFAEAFAQGIRLAGNYAQGLSKILDVLGPVPVDVVWDRIRVHLDGMAAAVDLPDERPFDADPVRWWVAVGGSTHHPRHELTEPSAALAQIAVNHVAHPTWTLREAATEVAAQRLAAGDLNMSDAVLRTHHPQAPDDLAEALGRTLSAARTIAVDPAAITALDGFDAELAEHDNWLIRELSNQDGRRVEPTPLPPRYWLAIPLPRGDVIGAESEWLGPYEHLVKSLARSAHASGQTAVDVVARRADELSRSLPGGAAIKEALTNAGLDLAYPSPEVWSARAAFGRFVREVVAAGAITPPLPPPFRFFDPDLVTLEPVKRPSFVPPPPEAGHDQTGERWLDEVATRLDEYTSQVGSDGWVVIAATSKAHVLNWDSPTEEYTCGSVVGEHTSADIEYLVERRGLLLSDLLASAPAAEVGDLEPVALRNDTLFFQQSWNHEWVALRPTIASALDFVSTGVPGEWADPAGHIVARTVRWTDGEFGQGGRHFDDAVAGGSAVVLAEQAVATLNTRFGALTRINVLKRMHHHDVATEVEADSYDPLGFGPITS